MAKKKENETEGVLFPELGDMTPGQTTTFDKWNVIRVPGGFVYSLGSGTCYVPLTELALLECGLEIKDLEE